VKAGGARKVSSRGLAIQRNWVEIEVFTALRVAVVSKFLNLMALLNINLDHDGIKHA